MGDIQFPFGAGLHQLQGFRHTWNQFTDAMSFRATLKVGTVKHLAIEAARDIVQLDLIVFCRLGATARLDDFVL